MKSLRYLLITDGSSDRVLTHIITWTLRQHLSSGSVIESHWAEPYRLPGSPPDSADRLKWLITCGLQLYENIDTLFVHRDAENQSPDQRASEIHNALAEIVDPPPPVFVIPVKMMEAWLLFDEEAIRCAAGNPNGRVRLKLPACKTIETIPNPKQVLHDLLLQASEAAGRHRKKFRPHQRVHRLAELIDDYAPLRNLPAFQALEADIHTLVEAQGWDG
ncbi:MAG: DUF4276 family protein [Anaerolineae bacterium]|nr:DUF4276 family protein [Anaerolineae bacterium]